MTDMKINARSNRPSKDRGWPFRDSSNDGETSIALNQRMVGQLLQRKDKISNLPAWQSRSYVALGIEVSQSREERTGRSMQDAAHHTGLDPAFFAIVEAGKIDQKELTPDVLKALARSVGTKVGDLESALSVQESYHSNNAAGQVVQAVLSLCQPSFLNTAVSYKSIHLSTGDRSRRSDRDDGSGLAHDAKAGISYRIGDISPDHPPSLVFYELKDTDTPLRGWHVSLRNGTDELASGVTDDQGLFRFPENMKDFPPNSHMIIRKKP